MASGIDTVIFDMDGVIFDSEILVLQAWKEVAERHGIAGVEAACHECLGTNSVVSKGVFLKHYGEDFPYEEYKAEMAEVFFSHASGGKLAKKPGVEELLKYLKMRGFKIGLASSTREALVRSEISDGGLLDIMDYISNSVMMPFIALLSTILIGWVMTPDYVIDEMERNGSRFRRKKLYRIMIRYVAPVMMFILFLQSTGVLS